MVNSGNAQASATGLVQGVYKYELTVTDNNGATGKDTVQVTVNAAANSNIPPVANAGPDIALVLPGNATSLRGSGSDADGSITTYQWRIISATGSYQLSSPNLAQPLFSNLEQGVYEAELTVTDNVGATGKDTVVITVAAQRISAWKNGLKIVPNPVETILTAAVTLADINSKIVLVLTDMRGTKLYQEEYFVTEPAITKVINMRKYAAGMYILTVIFGDGEKISRKVAKM